MRKVMIEVDKKQIEAAIEQLDITDKLALFKKLERQTRKERWDALTLKIRKRFKENPISEEEITRICEEVRQRIYEESTKGSS
ncbi:MAG: hypothetical protein GXO71_01455 [Caldiserica bacterium]|nr:hypothetical protein [Caldisericota bacterium]